MPPPPGICGASFSVSGISETIASVVSNRPAIEAAFCKAERVTLVGSHAHLQHVAVLFRLGVEPEVRVLFRLDLLYNDRAFESGVLHDLTERLFERATDYGDADFLVVVIKHQRIEHFLSANERHAAARNDSFFDGCLRRVHSIFDAGFLLFQLSLCSSADFDYSDSADELGKPLLQLLAVIIRSRLFDLRANLTDAAFDLGGFARAFDYRGVVFVDDDFLSAAQIAYLNALKLDAEVFRDRLAASIRFNTE